MMYLRYAVHALFVPYSQINGLYLQVQRCASDEENRYSIDVRDAYVNTFTRTYQFEKRYRPGP